MQTAAYAKVADVDKAFYLDSLKKDESRRYIDSISSEKVYFGYTFKDVRAKAINLGLDLKGGMNVMLQVQLKDLVQALAGGNNSPEFIKALDLAQERSVNSRLDFINKCHHSKKTGLTGVISRRMVRIYAFFVTLHSEYRQL